MKTITYTNAESEEIEVECNDFAIIAVEPGCCGMSFLGTETTPEDIKPDNKTFEIIGQDFGITSWRVLDDDREWEDFKRAI